MDSPKITLRPLLSSDFEQLYYSFLESFKNYPVNLLLGKDDFKFRIIERLKINFNYSIGAFSGEKMVAFILHTSGNFNGSEVAYNGGTGVIPYYRGLGLVGHMYAVALPLLKAAGLKSVVLEVLENNISAKKSYTKVGFEVGRYLRGFKLEKNLDLNDSEYIYKLSAEVEEDLVLKSNDVQSDFMGTDERLIDNTNHEKMIIAKVPNEDEALGYLVIQPKTGRINRFWVAPEARRKGLGTGLIQKAQLLSKNKELVALNVDATNTGACAFLTKMGFENQLNQFEMILNLA